MKMNQIRNWNYFENVFSRDLRYKIRRKFYDRITILCALYCDFISLQYPDQYKGYKNLAKTSMSMSRPTGKVYRLLECPFNMYPTPPSRSKCWQLFLLKFHLYSVIHLCSPSSLLGVEENQGSWREIFLELSKSQARQRSFLLH